MTKRDVRNVKELFVINSLSNPRPTLEKYKYAMPGEDAIRKSELHVGTREMMTALFDPLGDAQEPHFPEERGDPTRHASARRASSNSHSCASDSKPSSVSRF